MPRKAPLPQLELEIGRRLGFYRRRLEYPRRLFAKTIGVDTAVLTRIELGRAPLKYGLAAKILSAFAINPLWLASGVGGPTPGVMIPRPDSLGVNDSSLFSKVFIEKLAAKVKCRVTKLEGCPAFKYGANWHPADPKGRVIAEEFLIADVRQWIETIPSKRLNKLVNEIRFAAMRLLDDWENPSDSMELIERRRKRMDKVRQWFEERKKALSKSITTPPKNKLPAALGKPLVDSPHTSVMTPGMSSKIPKWKQIVAALKRLTKSSGAKAQLAKELKTSRQNVNKWLSNAGVPSAELTLKVFRWVEDHGGWEQK